MQRENWRNGEKRGTLTHAALAVVLSLWAWQGFPYVGTLSAAENESGFSDDARDRLSGLIAGRTFRLGTAEPTHAVPFLLALRSEPMDMVAGFDGKDAQIMIRDWESRLPLGYANPEFSVAMAPDARGRLIVCRPHRVALALDAAGTNFAWSHLMGPEMQSGRSVSCAIHVEWPFAALPGLLDAGAPTRCESDSRGREVYWVYPGPDRRIGLVPAPECDPPFSEAYYERRGSGSEALQMHVTLLDTGASMPGATIRLSDLTRDGFLGRTFSAYATQWPEEAMTQAFSPTTTETSARQLVEKQSLILQLLLKSISTPLSDGPRRTLAERMAAWLADRSGLLQNRSPLIAIAAPPAWPPDAGSLSRFALPKAESETIEFIAGGEAADVALLRSRSLALVPVRVNDKDAGLFLVDTGADSTFLDSKLAQSLGLPVTETSLSGLVGATGAQLDSARRPVESIEIGGRVRLRPGKILTADLSALSTPIGTPVAGILGCDVLAMTPFTLKLRDDLLVFHRTLPAPDPETTRKIAMVEDEDTRPAMAIRVFGEVLDNVLLDTGFNSNAVDVAAAIRDRHPDRFTGTPVRSSSTTVDGSTQWGEIHRLGGSEDPLELFGVPTSAPLRLVEATEEKTMRFAGVIPVPMLEAFEITFDLENDTAYVALAAPPKSPEEIATEGGDPLAPDFGGETALHRAAAVGEPDLFRRLVALGGDPTPDSVLSHALASGNLEILADVLAARRAAGVFSEPESEAWLAAATSYRLPGAIDALLKEGYKPGPKALGVAIYAKDPGIVARLLDAGSGTTITLANGEASALDVAADARSEPLMRLFLERGAEPSASTLERCVMGNFADGVKLVLEAGIPADTALGEGNALHYCAQFDAFEAAQALCAAGADVNARAPGGLTPLMIAAGKASPEFVRMLLKAGADASLAMEGGYTALHAAVEARKPEALKVLLDLVPDIDVSAALNGGVTPLHIAASKGDPASVALLVKRGADPSGTTNDLQTPLGIVATMSMQRGTMASSLNPARWQAADSIRDLDFAGTAEALLEAGATLWSGVPGQVDQLASLCAESDNLPVLERILRDQPPAGAHALDAALHVATMTGQPEIVARLLAPGAPSPPGEAAWNEALLIAAHQGQVQVLQLLLEAGASAETLDGEGNAAIHHAAFAGDPLAIRLLAAAGADVDAINLDEDSPLAIAARRRKIDAVRALLEAGADREQTNALGQTPHDIARFLTPRCEPLEAMLAQ